MNFSSLPRKLEAEIIASAGATFAQPGDEPGHENSIEADLITLGVPLELLRAVVGVMERRATEKAGELVRMVILSLGKSTKARALQRAIIGEFQSLTCDAGELGISKQALQKAEGKARAKLRKQFG